MLLTDEEKDLIESGHAPLELRLRAIKGADLEAVSALSIDPGLTEAEQLKLLDLDSSGTYCLFFLENSKTVSRQVREKILGSAFSSDDEYQIYYAYMARFFDDLTFDEIKVLVSDPDALGTASRACFYLRKAQVVPGEVLEYFIELGEGQRNFNLAVWDCYLRPEMPPEHLARLAKDSNGGMWSMVIGNPSLKFDLSYKPRLLMKAQYSFLRSRDLDSSRPQLEAINALLDEARSQVRPDFWDMFSFDWEGTTTEFIEYAQALDD